MNEIEAAERMMTCCALTVVKARAILLCAFALVNAFVNPLQLNSFRQCRRGWLRSAKSRQLQIGSEGGGGREGEGG